MLADMHTISKYFFSGFLIHDCMIACHFDLKMHEYYSRNFQISAVIKEPTKEETSSLLRNQEKLENPNLALVYGTAFCTLYCHSTYCSPALSKIKYGLLSLQGCPSLS